MSLRCAIAVAARGIDVTLQVPHGRTLALLGANGSGKSTLLGVLAGLLAADRAEIMLDGRDLAPLPAHRRRVTLMAQDPALFDHLGVLDNVAFAPRSAGLSKAQSRTAAARWLSEVGAEELAGRRPAQLSGGQAQRVALARALAADPDLLLLDEPLSALDVDAAARLRQTLRRVLAGRTSILVTHDMLDAVLLADEVAVLSDGRMVEAGATQQVMGRPTSRFAAGFFGWNLLRGLAIQSDAVRTTNGSTVRGVAQVPLVLGSPAVAAFRPAAVSVHLTPPTGSQRNTCSASIEVLEPQGHLVRVRAGGLAADITMAAVAELGLGPAVPVWLAVKAAEVALYPA